MDIPKPERMNIEVWNRLHRVEELYLVGITSPTAIANRLGTHPSTARNDIIKLVQLWVDRDQDRSAGRRAYRVEQLQKVIQKATNEFEKSKRSSEEITTSYHRAKCEDCKGTGMDGSDWCINCEGNGVIVTEQTIRKIKGKTGDPAYLETIRKATMDCAKLEGLVVKQVERRVDERILFGTTDATDWRKAPREQIIKAMVALDNLKLSVRDKGEKDVIDGTVVQKEDET